jgi:DNA-binding CsgD family transcriptional regulator
VAAANASDDLAEPQRRAHIDLGAEPATTPANGLGLTTREIEVVALLADRRTNGDIAAELYISTKSASVHVSNILRKLEASNRDEAAALAHRHTASPRGRHRNDRRTQTLSTPHQTTPTRHHHATSSGRPVLREWTPGHHQDSRAAGGTIQTNSNGRQQPCSATQIPNCGPRPGCP